LVFGVRGLLAPERASDVSGQSKTLPGGQNLPEGSPKEVTASLVSNDRLVFTLIDIEEISPAEVAALTSWSRMLVNVRGFPGAQTVT
jgi:hypothetical protein